MFLKRKTSRFQDDTRASGRGPLQGGLTACTSMYGHSNAHSQRKILPPVRKQCPRLEQDPEKRESETFPPLPPHTEDQLELQEMLRGRNKWTSDGNSDRCSQRHQVAHQVSHSRHEHPILNRALPWPQSTSAATATTPVVLGKTLQESLKSLSVED